jgi:hypothetical protein
MNKYIPVLLFILPFQVMSSDLKDDNPYKNDTIDSCFHKPMSGEVNACMIYMNGKEKNNYEKEFSRFKNKMTSSKDDLNDYDNFKPSILNAKKFWDKYIENECQANAHLNFNDSYAYYTDYNVCLAKAYKERANFYKGYKL